LVDLNIAINIDTSYIRAYISRAWLKLDQKQLHEAIDDLNIAISLRPIGSDASDAFNTRGYIKLQLENYRESLSDFDTAIMVEPSFAYPYNNRGYA